MLALLVWVALTVAAPWLAVPASELLARGEEALGWNRVTAEEDT